MPTIANSSGVMYKGQPLGDATVYKLDPKKIIANTEKFKNTVTRDGADNIVLEQGNALYSVSGKHFALLDKMNIDEHLLFNGKDARIVALDSEINSAGEGIEKSSGVHSDLLRALFGCIPYGPSAIGGAAFFCLDPVEGYFKGRSANLNAMSQFGTKVN